ncbi:hypothetical protein V1522DRAFT_218335 [Lipomyces starkeyi]
MLEDEGRGQVPAREGDRADIGVPARRALTHKETLERLRSRSYELEEGIDATQREKMRISGLDLCRERVPTSLSKKTQYIIVERERREAGKRSRLSVDCLLEADGVDWRIVL